MRLPRLALNSISPCLSFLSAELSPSHLAQDWFSCASPHLSDPQLSNLEGFSTVFFPTGMHGAAFCRVPLSLSCAFLQASPG